MIIGIGIDLCSVERMREQMDNARFQARIFTQKERAYFASRPAVAAASLAAGFAAKEAFLKAVGLGLGGIAMAEIEVLHKESGQPYYVLHGSADQWMHSRGAVAHLSLTHENGTAAAFCVIEGGKTA